MDPAYPGRELRNEVSQIRYCVVRILRSDSLIEQINC